MTIRKKILSFTLLGYIILLFLFPLAFSKASELTDYGNFSQPSDPNNNYITPFTTSGRDVGMRFIPNVDFLTDTFSLAVWTSGATYSGTMKAYISEEQFSQSGVYVTQSPTVSGTAVTAKKATLDGTEFDNITGIDFVAFEFDDQFQFIAGTTYWIVVDFDATGSRVLIDSNQDSKSLRYSVTNFDTAASWSAEFSNDFIYNFNVVQPPQEIFITVNSNYSTTTCEYTATTSICTNSDNYDYSPSVFRGILLLIVMAFYFLLFTRL
jgi:hypothetical protein